MAIYTVVLTDGTKGKVTAEHVGPGDRVTVSFRDENGTLIEQDGEVRDVLCQAS